MSRLNIKVTASNFNTFRPTIHGLLVNAGSDCQFVVSWMNEVYLETGENMSASTEAMLIQIVFAIGALVVVGGVISLIVARSKRQALRPTMSIILCGAGLAVIALLLNSLLFKSYDHVQLKKNQYYEVTSLTANMKQSLGSSHAANQPVSPQAKKASKNVTYLVKNLKQSKSALRLAQTAQTQMTTKRHPDTQLVRHNYRLILRAYFKSTGITDKQVDRATAHAYQQVTAYRRPVK